MKFLANDEQMYAIGVHLSLVDVSGNARTAVTNAQRCAFAQTRSLLFGPTFVKCIRNFRGNVYEGSLNTIFFAKFSLITSFLIYESLCKNGVLSAIQL